MGSGYDHDTHHWMDGHMNGGLGMSWGWLVMGSVLLICLAIIVALVVWVVRTSSSGSASTGPRSASAGPHSVEPGSRASAILDERFARGEIDEQEFLQRRQTLLSVHQP